MTQSPYDHFRSRSEHPDRLCPADQDVVQGHHWKDAGATVLVNRGYTAYRYECSRCLAIKVERIYTAFAKEHGFENTEEITFPRHRD